MVAAVPERHVVDLPLAAPLDKFLAALVASPLVKSAVGRLVVLQVMAVVLTDHALVQERLFLLLQLSVLVLLLKPQRLLLLHQQGEQQCSSNCKQQCLFEFSWGRDALTFERYKQNHQHWEPFGGKHDCGSNYIRDR